MTFSYRSEVDGLRAIAVLAVIFFHLGLGAFPGGFVGVDVFFVISGYLITSILYRDILSDQFTFADFYKRRFRRIIPAMLAMVLITTIASLLILDYESLTNYFKSTAANILFLSNVFFYFDSGYFSAGAETKPLLHTWSLAIEEQYYFFFPFLLLLVVKFGKKHKQSALKVGTVLFVLMIASFIVNVVGINYSLSGTFYLLPFRAWELVLGGILAVPFIKPCHNVRTNNALAVLGCLFIVIAVCFYSEETLFPGFAAALPALGAMLIIYSTKHKNTLVYRLLSHKLLVSIGLISYSLYLWHWPIIVLYSKYSIVELTLSEQAALLILIFIVSLLAYYLVEKPLRHAQFMQRGRNCIAAFALVLITVLASSSYVVSQNGLMSRYSSHLSSFELEGDTSWRLYGECQTRINLPNKNSAPCVVGDDKEEPSFILWGDSHARSLAAGVSFQAKKKHQSGYVTTRSACPPLLNVDRQGEQACFDFNQKVITFIEQNKSVETVILSARWALSSTGERYAREPGEPVKLVNLLNPSLNNNPLIFEASLFNTVALLNELGRKVIIVSGIPEIGYDVKSAYAIKGMFGKNIDALITPSLREYQDRNNAVEAVLTELEQLKNVSVVHPHMALCDKVTCKVTHDNYALYRDDDHLSTYGSLYVAKFFSF